MALALPKYAVFHSGAGYLRYVTEGVPGARQGYLQFSMLADAANPLAKFEIEAANTGDPRMVHIKSCYNNKYWARVSPMYESFLAACADAPDEDSSKWTCTLFLVVLMGPLHLGLYLSHVQANVFVSHTSSSNQCLHVSYYSVGPLLRLNDWDSLTILPRHLAFKSIVDERYLGVRSSNLAQEHTDIGRNGIATEASNARDGRCTFRSISTNRFWRLSGSWIMVDAANTTSEQTLFDVIKVGEGRVAIRNNRYLAKQRNSVNVVADLTTPVRPTVFEVEEAVLKRDIYHISYHLSDATIYDEQPLVMVTADASNAGTEDETLSLKLEFTEETTRSFNRSTFGGMSLGFDLKVGIPFISNGTITESAEVEYSKDWGETDTVTEVRSETSTVTVKPGTRMRLSVVATHGTCHVPFSYSQEDVLFNGERPITTRHDGLFVGANAYNSRIESVEEPLELKEL